ncbi:MAG: hypothetical protein KGH66_02130 [Candidatus Micrarchaeota archaeon]|nr:hypothetical protein [Candidatus Micrarchaeota archaeon]
MKKFNAGKQTDYVTVMKAYAENSRYIKENADSLLSQYAGRYIAVHEGKVIKVARTQSEVDDYVRELFKDDPPMVRGVPRGLTETVCQRETAVEQKPAIDLRKFNSKARLGGSCPL